MLIDTVVIIIAFPHTRAQWSTGKFDYYRSPLLIE